MKTVFYSALISFILVSSCTTSTTDDAKKDAIESTVEMKNKLRVFEDSLKNLTNYDPAVNIKYAEKCVEIYKADFKNKDAVKYLDKAHIIYSNSGNYLKAAELGDEIIKDYPDYANRLMVLQSLATIYDINLKPRDINKVKYYYELILTCPGVSKEEKENTQFRLNHLDKTFEELIQLRNN